MFISLLVAKYFYVLANLKLLVSCYAKSATKTTRICRKKFEIDPFRFFKRKITSDGILQSRRQKERNRYG